MVREAICENCGNIYHQKRSYQKYCSPLCGHEAQTNYPNQVEVEKTCPICNKNFLTARKSGKYCSRECYRKANRAQAAEYRLKFLSNDAFLRIRFQVLERDKFRCRYCGRTPDDGVRLEVDHIFPKSKKGQDILSNYITACRDCNEGKGDMLLLANKQGQLPTFIKLK